MAGITGKCTTMILVTMTIFLESVTCNDKHLPVEKQNITCLRNKIAKAFFQAVSTCANENTSEQESKCFKDFNLVDGTTTENVPVTDLSTSITYKSIQCAMCNGVKTSDVKHWTPVVSCITSVKLDLSQYENSLNNVFKTDECSFSFVPPIPGLEEHKCYLDAKTCNLTRAWQTNNSLTEIKHCYREDDTRVYRLNGVSFHGILCARCNGITDKALDEANQRDDGFLPAALSFLLFMTEEDGFTNKHHGKCDPIRIYDHFNDRCLDARCSILRKLQNSECTKVIDYVNVFTYKIGIRLIPFSTLALQDAIENTLTLKRRLFDILDDVFNRVIYYECEILFVLDNKYNDWKNLTFIQGTAVMFIEWRLKLNVGTQHDPEEALAILLSLSRYTNIRSDVNGQDVLFSIVILDFKENSLKADSLDQCHSNIKYDQTVCSNFDLVRSIETNKYNNNTFVRYLVNTNLRSMYSVFSTWPRNILEYRSCVFIEIFKKRYTWNEVGDGLEFMDINVTVPFSAFVYGSTIESILVCKDKYFQLEEYRKNAGTRFIFENKLIVLFIVCLYYFM